MILSKAYVLSASESSDNESYKYRLNNVSSVTPWIEKSCSNALKNGVHVLYGLRQMGKSLMTDFNNFAVNAVETSDAEEVVDETAV